MRSFIDFQSARDYADHRSAHTGKAYYVAQDARTGFERYLVGTYYQYIRSRHALPAKYVIKNPRVF